MTFLNEGRADRTARMLGGLLLPSAGWALSFNVLGIVLVTVGAICFATGIVGWCPAYTLFGFSTAKTPADHCSNCAAEHRQV